MHYRIVSSSSSLSSSWTLITDYVKQFLCRHHYYKRNNTNRQNRSHEHNRFPLPFSGRMFVKDGTYSFFLRRIIPAYSKALQQNTFWNISYFSLHNEAARRRLFLVLFNPQIYWLFIMTSTETGTAGFYVNFLLDIVNWGYSYSENSNDFWSLWNWNCRHNKFTKTLKIYYFNSNIVEKTKCRKTIEPTIETALCLMTVWCTDVATLTVSLTAYEKWQKDHYMQFTVYICHLYKLLCHKVHVSIKGG